MKLISTTFVSVSKILQKALIGMGVVARLIEAFVFYRVLHDLLSLSRNQILMSDKKKVSTSKTNSWIRMADYDQMEEKFRAMFTPTTRPLKRIRPLLSAVKGNGRF